MLRTTLGGFGTLAFSGLAAHAAGREPHFPPKAKRVILLYMHGGVSHVDTFDYKPRLNADHGKPFGRDGRGGTLLGSPWKFARHGRSGQWMSELFPHLARHADKLCVLAGMRTAENSHTRAVPLIHTGHALQVRPSLGSWVLYGLGSESDNLPGFIAMNPLPDQDGGTGNHGSAFLPAASQATYLRPPGRGDEAAMPNLTPTHLTGARQRLQLDLLEALNRQRLARDVVNDDVEAVIESYERAFRMQSAVPSLVDLTRESPATLHLYGIGDRAADAFGRQCLLARRFAEAGVRFIEIGTGGWDQHENLAQDLAARARGVDRPAAGLLADLEQRGLLEDTLVVWASEFGRTPYAQNGNGRDHNNRGFTVWMAGGGVKPGFRYGLTDDYGAEAVEGLVDPHDLHATLLHCLGLDHERLTVRYGGRDFRLTEAKGRVVKPILA
jgi:hypothetical protein